VTKEGAFFVTEFHNHVYETNNIMLQVHVYTLYAISFCFQFCLIFNVSYNLQCAMFALLFMGSVLYLFLSQSQCILFDHSSLCGKALYVINVLLYDDVSSGVALFQPTAALI